MLSDVSAVTGAQNFFKFLPAVSPPSKAMKVSLRFASITISEVSRNSLVTLKMSEKVNLVNEGRSIDPRLLSVAYLKNSEENVRMTKWELVSYSETEI